MKTMSDLKKNPQPRKPLGASPTLPAAMAAREDRAEETARERRRRKDSSLFDFFEFKLHVPEEEKNPDYVYSWINDVGANLLQKTQMDDWNICTVEEFSPSVMNTGGGSQISRVVGRDSTGAPFRAYLCKKRREYEEEDQRKRFNDIDRIHNQMRQGDTPGAQGLAAEDPNLRYIPREARA